MLQIREEFNRLEPMTDNFIVKFTRLAPLLVSLVESEKKKLHMEVNQFLFDGEYIFL